MKFYFSVFLISHFILTSVLQLNAQKTQGTIYTTTDKRAIKLFEQGAKYYDIKKNDDALKYLKKSVESDPNFIEAHTMMSYVYQDMNQFEKAIEELKTAISIKPGFFNGMYFTLGEIELNEAKYTDAKIHLEEYLKGAKTDPYLVSYAKKYITNCNFAIEAMKHPVAFVPKNLGETINTKNAEYFATITADEKTFYFTRRFGRKGSTQGFQEDIYVSKNVDGKWTKAESVGGMLNTSANEGAVSVAPDGQILFFVACENYDGYGQNRKGYGSCDIFFSRKIGEGFSNPKNLSKLVNTRNWETQPSFSSDGQTLYFVRGTITNKKIKDQDIWMSRIDSTGAFGEPVKLSGKINTNGMEESVFIHPDNMTLYFSSDGHPGMGGLDIFMSKRQPNGEWGNPVNLGYPINTSKDESSLLVSPDGTTAFFSSDREGGFGDLDLYSFELDKSLRPEKITYFKGKVYDAKSKKPLEVFFEVVDLTADLKTGKNVVESYSNPENGEFLITLNQNNNYALNINKEGYQFYSENFSLKDKEDNSPYLIDVPLQPIESGIDFTLKNVFFETNKYDLKPESMSELDKLVTFLNYNKTVTGELGGHTDNVGDDKSNLTLSENRAKSVYSYLISKGISSERLSFNGYGETQFITTNDSEGGRAKNRRTVFKIISK